MGTGSSIPSIIIIILFAVVFFKLITVPVKWIFKLLINAASGLVMLFIFNLVASFAGFSLSITPLNCIVAGLLGIPGVALLILIKIFI